MKYQQQKEIEEMKQTLVDYAMEHSLCFSFDAFRTHAKTLYDAGYGNIKQAVKEFADKLKGRINELIELPCVGMTERKKWVSEGQKDALCDCLSMVDEIFEEGKV